MTVSNIDKRTSKLREILINDKILIFKSLYYKSIEIKQIVSITDNKEYELVLKTQNLKKYTLRIVETYFIEKKDREIRDAIKDKLLSIKTQQKK